MRSAIPTTMTYLFVLSGFFKLFRNCVSFSPLKYSPGAYSNASSSLVASIEPTIKNILLWQNVVWIFYHQRQDILEYEVYVGIFIVGGEEIKTKTNSVQFQMILYG